jgi:hypothetical protein
MPNTDLSAHPGSQRRGLLRVSSCSAVISLRPGSERGGQVQHPTGLPANPRISISAPRLP